MSTFLKWFALLQLIGAATGAACVAQPQVDISRENFVTIEPGQTTLPAPQGPPPVRPFTVQAGKARIPTAPSLRVQPDERQEQSLTAQPNAPDGQPLANSLVDIQTANCTPAGSQPAPLVALAYALKCDVDLIFEYVYNNIEYEPLYGSNKGTLGTLLDRRGNDADQAILFVTLLKIAGYSQTAYANVYYFLTGDEIASFLGVKNDATAIQLLLLGGGIPFDTVVTNPDGSLASINLQHFLGAVQLNGVWYYFDPSFKSHTVLPGIPNLSSALGYDKTQFLTDVGGSIDSISISNVNRANLRSDLAKYAANLVDYINQHDRTLSVGNLIGGKSIQPFQNSPSRWQLALPLSFTFPVNCPNQITVTECRTFLTITMPGASSSQAIKLYTDEVYGHRITIFSTPSGSKFIPTLLIDGAPPSCVTGGSCTNTGPATDPGQIWSVLTQVTQTNQPADAACGSGITACGSLTIAAGGSYLVSTGVGMVARGMVEYHRQLLAKARATGNSDNSEPVLGENLAVIGYGWLSQIAAETLISDQLVQITTLYKFGVGIIAQANIQQSRFQGPYVDLPIGRSVSISTSSTGPTITIGGFSYPAGQVRAIFASLGSWSALESAVLEQTQAPAGMTAASTAKLADANMDLTYPGSLGRTFFADGTTSAGQSVYTNNIIPLIQSNYDPADLAKISASVAGGNQVLIPQNGKLSVGLWSGGGFFHLRPVAGGIGFGATISGGMSGAYSGTNVPDPAQNTQVTLPPAAGSDTISSLINTISSTLNPLISEPIDGVTGAYLYKNDDLVTGSGKFPYALGFSRTYLSFSGTRLTTTAADAGLGNGWAHSWSSNVKIQSDPYSGIGTTNTPAATAASTIAAIFVIQDLMANTPTVQTFTLTAMVARWLTDQLTGNVAIATQPDTTEEFVALPHPDGNTNVSYSAPPGSSARLVQSASGQFSYTRKDGVVLNFGPTPAGALQNIIYPSGVTINLTYSGSNLVRIENNLERSFTLSYNGSHISTVADDSGRNVAYTYDNNNNLAKFADPLGAATIYSYDTSGTYDTLGHLTQVFYPSFPANAFVTNWYDALGRVVKQANANGAVSTFYFAGSRTEQIDPLQNRHVTYQTDRGRVLSDAWVLSSNFGNVFNNTVQQNGVININRNYYDGLDRLYATVFPEGGYNYYFYASDVNPWANNISAAVQVSKLGPPSQLNTIFAYDATYNKPTNITDPRGLVGKMDYDSGTGNLRSAVNDAGAGRFNATSRFTYSATGQVVTATDPLGTVTQFLYDSFGNQTSIIGDAGVGRLNQLTLFGYNAQGDVISITDPRGNVTTKSYDAARRLITTTAPNGLVTTYSYNPDGLVTQTQQSANGMALRRTSATYTLTGKPATAIDANNNTTTLSYDVLDRVSSVKDAVGRTTSYGYDALSRQVSISNLAIQGTPLLQKSFTPDGLVASLTDANNHTTSFAYDVYDRLATTTYPPDSTNTQTTEALTYDADSNVTSRKTRANQTIAFTYDTLNRLCTKTIAASSTACTATSSPSPTVWYGYDLAGRLTSTADNSSPITTAVPPSGSSVQYVTSTTYDALNRPTGISWSPAPAAAAPSASSVTFNHAYNKANQRIGQSVTDNSWFNYPAATRSTINYTANALNQYTAVGGVTPSYDRNGNLTFDGTFTFGYDAENRLTGAAAGIGTFDQYDAQGRRKRKVVNTTTTVFVTDAGNREVLEYDGNGAIQRWYAYGLGSNDVLNQMNVAANTRATFLPDVQGSVIASIDSSSGTLSKIAYSPYGKSASNTAPFGYTAQRIDPETNGLYYYRARHYSPAWGRFMQSDPIGYSGGINLYAYVNNDPLNFTDPNGLAKDAVVAAVGASAAPELAQSQAVTDFVQQHPQAAMIEGAVGLAIPFGGVAIGLAGDMLVGAAGLSTGNLTALTLRANQIHGALDPIAQTMRTTAALGTTGETIIAGGIVDLVPAQRALLLAGEVAARLPGAHAEITALTAAQEAGFAPRALATTRAICPACAAAIESLGGRLVGANTAVFPR